MKICTKCKIEKPLDEFSRDSTKKDGLQIQCKSCNKAYYQDNKEKIAAYREANKGKIAEYRQAYREANKGKIAEYHKAYKKTNKEELAKKRKAYYQSNKEKINKKITEYIRNRRRNDPLFKLKDNLRNRTYMAFKAGGYRKSSKTKEILGVDWEVASAHIERQFTKGMTWDNYGQWHIDHIIPLATAKTEEELIKLCHYSNLQPLWAEENLTKKDRIERGTQSKLRI